MTNPFKHWHLDLNTFLFTALIIPISLVIRKILIKYVKEWTTYAWEGVMYLIGKYIKHSIAASLSMKKYCKLQLGNDSIKYLYVPSSRDINLEIDKIFVNLTITYIDEKENNFSHQDFLKIGNRIKVMGDPGAGKSSLIKKVFRQSCEFGIKRASKAKFPVLIELKNLVPPAKKGSNLGKWFYEYIQKEISINNIYEIEKCFDIYSTTSGLLILLDGLDEVSTSNYSFVAKCINDLSKHLNGLSRNNTIVLTMRTQFYQQIKADFKENYPHASFIKPFTPSDIYDFLSRWYFEKDAEKSITRIYTDLTDRPTLREMCSNPLILSMYVAEDQVSQNNVSPDSRTQFYKKVTEELIIKRRLVQTAQGNTSYTSTKEHREQILGRIAYEHLTNIDEPRNMLSFNNAINIIKKIVDCNDSKAESIFYEISKETGLITEEKYKETFRFIHLTFCEFLAAFEVAEGIKNGWDELINNQKLFYTISKDTKSRLSEVIPFASGLLPRVSKEQALNDVSSFNDMTLMSRCFLETKLYNYDGWKNFVEKSKTNLLNKLKTNFNEKWLEDLHLFNVVVRDANMMAKNTDRIEVIDLTSFYSNLLDEDKNIINKILSAYSNQDAAAVFRLSEISKVNLVTDFPDIIIQNCDQLPFLSLVKDKIIEDYDERENWAALLSESALRKKIVCLTINDLPPDSNLSDIISNQNYNIWYHKRLIKETFMTQCVTLATKNDLNTNSLKCLNLLFELRSPTQMKLKFRLLKSISLVSFLVIIIPNLIPGVHVFFRAHEWGAIIFLLSAELSFIFFIPAYIYLKNFYQAALNLRSSFSINGLYINALVRLFNVLSFGGVILFKRKDRKVLKEILNIRGESYSSLVFGSNPLMRIFFGK